MKNKLPEITFKLKREHKDGSASYEFTYNQDFVEIVKKDLGKKKVSKREISNFLLESLKETAVNFEKSKYVKSKKL